MPELPDVELYRQRLDGGGLNRRIARVVVSEPRVLRDISPRGLGARLRDASILSSRRHGKYLFAETDAGFWVEMHFGMTGSLQIYADPELAPDFERVRLDFSDGGRLAYTSRRLLGHIAVVDDPDAFIVQQELGIDALDPALTQAAFAALLAGRRGAVKSALMDQSLIAGIGNIYSDEILFQAHVHPRRAANRLTEDEQGRVYAATQGVLKTAIAVGAGSEQFLDRLPEDFLLPHREVGGSCPRCGGQLEGLKTSGRTGYFCPTCQPA